ncbi:MAG: MMPL family transporter, partial [Polyangiales bacterium]
SVLVTLAFATQIPKLTADPAPESLLSSFEGEEYALIQQRFEDWFGERREAVLILVEADDVLSRDSLQQIHDLSLYFAEKSWVEKVAGITTLNIPRRVKGATNEDEGDLDDLDYEDGLQEVGGADDEGDLDSLDDLDDLDSLDEPGDKPDAQGDLEDAMFNALLDIIESDPDRFPGGIAEVGPALSAELETDPIVEGAEVTEEEASELAAAILSSPLLVGRLIDEDHTVAGIALQLHELDPKEMRRAMDELRDSLERAEFQDIKVHVGGLPYLRSVIVSKMREDNLRLIPLTVLVCLILLTLSFRWMPGVLLPLAAVAITALVTVGGMGLFGEPMNILNNVIVPLLIIIGISDATHLIQRYRDEVHTDDDPDRQAAGRRTVRAIAVACMLTSATTAVGLGSLVVSRTVMLRHFGITAGLGVMVSYVVIITFVPAVLTWATPPKRADIRKERTSMFTNVTSGLVARLLRWRWAVLGATALFTVGAGYVASQITVDHALLDQFDESDPVYTTTLLIEEKRAGVRPLEVVLVSTEEDHFMDPKMVQKIPRIRNWAALRPEIIRSLSYGDMLRESYALLADDPSVRSEYFKSKKQVKGLVTMMSQRQPSPLSAWLTEDGKKARIQFKLRDVGAQATMRFLDVLENVIDGTLRGEDTVSVSYTGEAYTGSRGQAAVVNDLLGSLLVAVVIIF